VFTKTKNLLILSIRLKTVRTSSEHRLVRYSIVAKWKKSRSHSCCGSVLLVVAFSVPHLFAFNGSLNFSHMLPLYLYSSHFPRVFLSSLIKTDTVSLAVLVIFPVAFSPHLADKKLKELKATKITAKETTELCCLCSPAPRATPTVRVGDKGKYCFGLHLVLYC